MSSFKNAKKSLQKTHRERGQPGQRKKFGLLEKHKDYVLRAKDFHRKEDHLKLLREKARNKNPDEFYYKMVKNKTQSGVHVTNRSEGYSADQMKILKSQDLNYARMKRAIERGKIDRLRESLHFISGDGEGEKLKNSHILFAEDKSEVDKVAKLYEKVKVRNEMKHSSSVKIEKEKRKSYNELDKRRERERKLMEVEQGLQMQKYLMGKGRCKKLKNEGDGSPAVYKWRKQRKK